MTEHAVIANRAACVIGPADGLQAQSVWISLLIHSSQHPNEQLRIDMPAIVFKLFGVLEVSKHFWVYMGLWRVGPCSRIILNSIFRDKKFAALQENEPI